MPRILNMLTWLKETDYDAWLYLYKNYLIHIVNARKMHPQIHRPIHFKKMFKNLQKEYRGTPYQRFCESRSYARYVGAKYTIDLPCGMKALDYAFGTKYYIGGKQLEPFDEQDYRTRIISYGMRAKRISKDDLIDICRENDLNPRVSWNKPKLFKLIYTHPNNWCILYSKTFFMYPHRFCLEIW